MIAVYSDLHKRTGQAAPPGPFIALQILVERMRMSLPDPTVTVQTGTVTR